MTEMENQVAIPVKRLRFKNPPIVEAVIFFEVAALPASAIDDFQSSSEAMRTVGYELPETVTKHELEIKFEGAVPSFGGKGSSAHGLKFKRADGLYAVQFNRDGFVFSRLERYDTWEEFRFECTKIWRIYSAVSGVADVKSYGVRYINKIYIPLGEDSEEYVRIFPKLPDGIPPVILDCFMRLGLPIEEPRGKLVHQQILLPPDKPGYSSVLIDNDFRFPALGLRMSEVWEQLEQVRYVKDYYFDQFLTKKMKDTFNV
jgi:uncharacterized protein (TIGR04255 family)